MLIQFDMMQYSEPVSGGKYRLVDDAPDSIIERAKRINNDSKDLYSYAIIENVRQK